MYIFGGFVNGDRANEVFRFDFQKQEWKQIDAGAKQPAARAGHSACVVADDKEAHMYIFGGKDNDDKILNDMWRLNLSTN